MVGLKDNQELMALLGISSKGTSTLCEHSVFNNNNKERKEENTFLERNNVSL